MERLRVNVRQRMFAPVPAAAVRRRGITWG